MHDDIDWAAMADMLEREGEAYDPYVRQAIEELGDLSPKRVLDIGSGPGVAACRFAASFPDAAVTAVDGSAELLQRADKRAARLGVQLHSQVVELPDGLAGLEPADLVWSSQVVHHVGDQQAVLNQLAELLNPGGVMAIVEGGLPARWLPRDLGFGRPGLHARLDVAMTERFNQMRADLPGSVAVCENWSSLLQAAGLTGTRSKTFLVEHPAPLAEGPRKSVRRWLERYRDGLVGTLDADDLATLDRLLDPDDPECVDRRPDVFLLTAKTVHYGRRG